MKYLLALLLSSAVLSSVNAEDTKKFGSLNDGDQCPVDRVCWSWGGKVHDLGPTNSMCWEHKGDPPGIYIPCMETTEVSGLAWAFIAGRYGGGREEIRNLSKNRCLNILAEPMYAPKMGWCGEGEKCWLGEVRSARCVQGLE